MWKRSAVAVWVGFALATSGTAASADFETSDLEGHWTGNSLWDLPDANDPGFDHYDVDVSESGTITGGSAFNIDIQDSPVVVDGDAIAIDRSGLISGTITTSVGIDTPFSDYQMEPGREAFVGVQTDLEGYDSLAVAVRRGAGYQSSDLQTTWWTYLLLLGRGSEAVPAGTTLWGTGFLTPGEGGVLMRDSLIGFSNGGCFEFGVGNPVCLETGGTSMSINSTGEVTWLADEGTKQLSSSKSLMVGAHQTGFDQAKLEIMLKNEGTYQTSDLAGTWRVFQAYGDPTSSEFGWRRGTLVVTEDGQIVGGQREDRNGSSDTVTGGQLTVTDGFISGDIDYADSTDERLFSFRMDSGKGLVVGVCVTDSTWTGDNCPDLTGGLDKLLDPSLVIWVPEPSSTLQSLAACSALFGLRRRQRRMRQETRRRSR